MGSPRWLNRAGSDVVYYNEGDHVAVEGAHGHHMYIVVSGEAVATKAAVATLHSTYRQGDFFGELALMDHAVRAASADPMALWHRHNSDELIHHAPPPTVVAEAYHSHLSLCFAMRGTGCGRTGLLENDQVAL